MSHHGHHGHHTHSPHHGPTHDHGHGGLRRGRSYRQTFLQEMQDLVIFALFGIAGFGFAYAGTEALLHALHGPPAPEVTLVQPTPTPLGAELARARGGD